MPGQPRRAKFEEYIRLIGEDHPRHPDWVVFDHIAEGKTMRETAETFQGFLEGDPDFPSRSWMYVWIHDNEEREERWEEAKRIGSHNIEEDAEEMVEDADPVTGADVSYLKLLAERKDRRAAAYNPETYGDKKDEPQLQLSIGELHLNDLRQLGSMADDEQIEGGEEPEMIEAEAEVVD